MWGGGGTCSGVWPLAEWRRHTVPSRAETADQGPVTQCATTVCLYTRAVNDPSRSFTVPGEGTYQGLYIVESAY